LEAALFPVVAPTIPQKCPAPDWAYIHSELKRKGVTLMLLWQEYKATTPAGYSYSQFCYWHRQFVSSLEISMRQTHKAGEKCFVDYAGLTVPIVDAKGRVQFIFRLFKYSQEYYLQLPKNLIPHAINCLQKYAALFKIKLEEIQNPGFIALIKQKNSGSNSDYFLQNIIHGIPVVYPETIGLFTPHQINLQSIENAVSFTKGCYTGQEIIARMQYLGKLKQQMYRVYFNSEKKFMAGTKFYNSLRENIGELVDCAPDKNKQQWQALAVLQNSAIDQIIYINNSKEPILQILALSY